MVGASICETSAIPNRTALIKTAIEAASDLGPSRYTRRMSQRTHATVSEMTSWALFAVGAFVAIIAFLGLQGASNDPYFNVERQNVWMYTGAAIAGVAFIPAMILTGLRQLLPSVHAAGQRTPSAADGDTDGRDR